MVENGANIGRMEEGGLTGSTAHDIEHDSRIHDEKFGLTPDQLGYPITDPPIAVGKDGIVVVEESVPSPDSQPGRNEGV